MHARSDRRPERALRFAIVAAIAATACAGASWEQVRAQDTPAAYRRFLADHPRSKHAPEANERLAVLQLEREPSREALERFRATHPDSEALPDLLARVETHLFEAARADGTAAAYSRFLELFPDGELAARARGNRAYLDARGHADHVDQLTAFLQEHPESDFAAEARRSLAALQARNAAAFGAVSLRIEIADRVADAARLHGVFAERARAVYAAAGARLSEATGGATLTIRHDERAVAASDGGVLARPGVLAETEVALVASDGAEIFRDTFSWRVVGADVRPGSAAVFAASAAPYWERFFVPVAGWPTAAALRATWNAGAPLSGVSGELGRALALAPDGSFRELDLVDPTQPRVVSKYVRSDGVARFHGIARAGGRVVLFGEDGAEIVARQAGGYRRVAALDRGVVGSAVGIAVSGDRLLVAGSRGLVRTTFDGAGVERLIERPLRGMARAGDTLYLLDDQWLYAGPANDPRPTNFFTAAEIGRPFHPRLLRAGDSIGVVIGDAGVATFALSAAGARPLARLRPSEIGAVADAAVLGGALFALGDRGLLVLDAATGRTLDSVDVDARGALGAAGSHLVAIGGERLDVVDAAPWIARGGAAALAR
jgi:hypothetical protein